jgi:hypothetical protein
MLYKLLPKRSPPAVDHCAFHNGHSIYPFSIQVIHNGIQLVGVVQHEHHHKHKQTLLSIYGTLYKKAGRFIRLMKRPAGEDLT